MHLSPSAPRRFSDRQAFTLVEVTLALGIVGFSLLVTLGLVTTANQTSVATRRDTIYANVVQYVNANANLTPFADLKDPTVGLDGKVWGFDSEGFRNDTNPVYRAQISVVDAPLLPAQSSTSTGTKTVNVKVTDGGTLTTHAVTYHLLVGNLGK